MFIHLDNGVIHAVPNSSPSCRPKLSYTLGKTSPSKKSEYISRTHVYETGAVSVFTYIEGHGPCRAYCR